MNINQKHTDFMFMSGEIERRREYLSLLSLCNAMHVRISDFFSRSAHKNIKSFDCFEKVAAFISVGKAYHEGQSLRNQLITLKRAAEHNKVQIWIVVADSLQKYNLMAKGLPEDKAFEKSVQAGKNWVKDNKDLIRNILGEDFRICFWEDILKDPHYVQYKKNVDALYSQGKKIAGQKENFNSNKTLKNKLAFSLYEAVKETVENFARRNDILLNSENKKHYLEYIKVELAVLDVSKVWKIKCIVYPKQANKALQFWNMKSQKRAMIKFPRLKKTKKSSASKKELENLRIVQEAKIIKKMIGQVLFQGKKSDDKKRIDLKTKWNLVKVTRFIFDNPDKISDDFLEKTFSFLKSNEMSDHTILEKEKTNLSLNNDSCCSDEKIGLSLLN